MCNGAEIINVYQLQDLQVTYSVEIHETPTSRRSERSDSKVNSQPLKRSYDWWYRIWNSILYSIFVDILFLKQGFLIWIIITVRELFSLLGHWLRKLVTYVT